MIPLQPETSTNFHDTQVSIRIGMALSLCVNSLLPIENGTSFSIVTSHGCLYLELARFAVEGRCYS